MEKFSTVPMNTVRRPITSAMRPQMKAPRMAPTPDEVRMIADSPNVRCHGLMMKASTKAIR